MPLASAVGRLWTCHRMWAPAAGCGVFLYELVPSDDPFMWCLCETFFCGHFFFPTDFFFPSEQQIKFVTSTTTAAVRSKSNSHVTVYYQPVEFTSCVFAVLFLRRRRCCLEATIWAHNCPSDLLGGCWRHGGAGTSQVVSK